MSQAVIDFCENLKTTLLGIEAGLAKAKRNVAAGAAYAGYETKEHLDEAIVQLNAFKTQAAEAAKKWRDELPQSPAELREKTTKAAQEFGLEAQVALRHAAVIVAEAASKGAENAAVALQAGAQQAQNYAEGLRRDTAVVPADEPKNDGAGPA